VRGFAYLRQPQACTPPVKQEHVRLFDQRPAQGDTLLLSTRELCRFALQEALDLHQRGNLFHLPGDDSTGLPLHTQGESEILEDGEMGIERVALKDHANIALTRRHIIHDSPIEAQHSTRRPVDTSQHQQGSGFAAATGSEQGQKLTLGNGAAEILHRRHRAKILADLFQSDSSHAQ